MFVRMKTLCCGPLGVWCPDKSYDLPDSEAVQLIEGGYADPVGGYVPPLPSPVELEPVVEVQATKTKKPKFYKSAE